MEDIITIFSRLTKSEVDDCLFETVLDKHYDKFKYFYKILVSMDDNNIITMSCAKDYDGLEFIVELSSKDETKKYSSLIKKNFKNLNDIFYNEYFNYKIIQKDTMLSVRILCNVGSESNIYEKYYTRL